MALQRIPWAVNGPNVPHSATLARQANFAALGGQTGIVGPYSLEVVAGEAPGPYVEVMPGSGTITYAHGSRQTVGYASAKDQLVPVRNDSKHRVDIAPTTSAGGRVDLVCVVINDPEFEGTAGDLTPEQWADHEFVRFHVIQGVGNSVRFPFEFRRLGRPVLPLARVHIPASTAAITDDMIRDVRFMAQAQKDWEGQWRQQAQTVTIDTSSYREVVRFGGILMPQWATHCRVSGTASSMIVQGTGTGTFTGQLRGVANFGQEDRFRWTTYIREEQVTGGTRLDLPIQGWFHVFPNERGRTGEFWLEARRTYGDRRLTFQEQKARYDLTFFFSEAPTIQREDEIED